MALRHPDRISHLILLDTAPNMHYGAEIMESAQQQGATEEMMAVLQKQEWASDEELRQGWSLIAPLYFKNFDETVFKRLYDNVIMRVEGDPREGELQAYNVTPRLGEIDIPTLVLVGRHDFVCPPSQAHIMHDGIPGAELVIFEDSGHFPWVEEPDLFFDTVRDWIKRTG